PGNGNAGVPETCKQGTEDMKRGPHFADQIVRSLCPEDIGSIDCESVVIDPAGGSAESAQKLHHGEGITDPGNVAKCDDAFGKNCARHDCEGGVFAAAGAYAPVQSSAALYIYPVQKVDS